MKRYDIYAVGHALVDILIRVNTSQLSELGLQPGSRALVTEQVQREMIARLAHQPRSLASGGSVANSMIAVAQLGGSVAFSCCYGDDQFGVHFQREMREIGVDVRSAPIVSASSGTSLILIDPSGERTMRTCLAVAQSLDDTHVDTCCAADSRFVFLEGYILSNGQGGERALQRLASIGRRAGASVACALSDPFIVRSNRSAIASLMPSLDLLFTNQHEALELTGESDTERAFLACCERVRNVVMTRGEQSVLLRYEGEVHRVETLPCTPVDVTGAGDMFAGAFLYGITHGFSAFDSARAANALCMKVITQVGARLHGPTVLIWKEALTP